MDHKCNLGPSLAFIKLQEKYKNNKYGKVKEMLQTKCNQMDEMEFRLDGQEKVDAKFNLIIEN